MMTDINAGRFRLSKSSIIICGIVRDCERGLKKNIPVIDKLCDLAEEYNVFIFENDSKDNTKFILEEWKKKRKNIQISINDFKTITIPSKSIYVNRFFSQERIGKMAKYRNKYLEYIEDNKLIADFVIVVDLDVDYINLDGILDSFGKKQEWDAITANGYIYSPSAFFRKRYNDTYALIESGMENIPQTEDSINENRYKWAFLKSNMPAIRVFSAFGGLSIYKFEAIRNCRYSVIENGDNKVEVRCEHFSLCKQMSENGYDKVFINPQMKIRYRPYLFENITLLKK